MEKEGIEKANKFNTIMFKLRKIIKAKEGRKYTDRLCLGFSVYIVAKILIDRVIENRFASFTLGIHTVSVS